MAKTIPLGELKSASVAGAVIGIEALGADHLPLAIYPGSAGARR